MNGNDLTRCCAHPQSDNEMEKPKGGGDDFEHDLEANASAFEALERDFQEVSGAASCCTAVSPPWLTVADRRF